MKVENACKCTPGDKCTCSGGKCCCSGCKWIVLAVILIVAAVAYFTYGEYVKYKSAPYIIKETNGVTTVSPGPGLVPDGPPTVNPPTLPAPKN